MVTRCICYGQIQRDKMLFERTNPSQRSHLYGDTMYKYTRRTTVLGHEIYLWGYDLCTKGEYVLEGDVHESMQMETICIFREPILWGGQDACTKGSVLCGKVVYMCFSIEALYNSFVVYVQV